MSLVEIELYNKKIETLNLLFRYPKKDFDKKKSIKKLNKYLDKLIKLQDDYLKSNDIYKYELKHNCLVFLED